MNVAKFDEGACIGLAICKNRGLYSPESDTVVRSRWVLRGYKRSG